MQDFARIFDLKNLVFRHSSMYGCRQFATYNQGWIGWFCPKAIETKRGELKEPFTISGDGKQVRDVLHAEEMVRLYFAGVEHMEEAAGKVCNIGGGMDNILSLLELFAMLEKELDVKLNYKKLPWRESVQKVFVADTSKAQELLKWQPEVSKEEGIRKMLEWVKTL